MTRRGQAEHWTVCIDNKDNLLSMTVRVLFT